jgi:riboflavin synthase
MFTGIIEELGEIVSVDMTGSASNPQDARITVRGPKVTADVAHGDSIAVSGVCLTVVGTGTGDAAGTFTAELMAETLARTTAATWQPGTRVNLERSVTPSTRLGGHIVQGHVDGVGTLVARTENTGYDDVAVTVPGEIGRYIAGKGAVAVDGISLTVIDVTDTTSRADQADSTTFTLGIIPETRSATTMGRRQVGDTVNIEVDVMAKYAERLLTFHGGAQTRRQAVSA